MPRKSIMIETAQQPKGNIPVMGAELEQVLELATDPTIRPEGLTIGVVFLELSRFMGELAQFVHAIWFKQDYDPKRLLAVLRLIMVYCLITLEALHSDP